jgi:hypothetical protein
MDGYKEDDHYHRMYALAGSLNGLGATGMSQLSELDMSAAECIGFIFLQV